jgi:hypothetical protein
MRAGSLADRRVRPQPAQPFPGRRHRLAVHRRRLAGGRREDDLAGHWRSPLAGRRSHCKRTPSVAPAKAARGPVDGNAGYMREQVCKYMCPYARFQSAMFDRDTRIIS